MFSVQVPGHLTIKDEFLQRSASLEEREDQWLKAVSIADNVEQRCFAMLSFYTLVISVCKQVPLGEASCRGGDFVG